MKSYAALTGALLARQGEASPSRPAAPTLELDLSRLFMRETRPNPESDLPAWWTRAVSETDARPAAAPPAAKPLAPPSIPEPQRANGVAAVPGPAPIPPPTATVLPASAEDGPVTMTLRLDRDRHVRLKIAAAKSRRSSAELIRAALDRHLQELASYAPNACACLARSDLKA